jgi:hypothetical protein
MASVGERVERLACLIAGCMADELDAKATEGSSAWVTFFYIYNDVTPVPL